MKKARIVGLGSYLPEKILTNADLEKIVETSDEWIVTRTGMRERRIAGAEEFTSDMGLKAAQAALKEANLEPEALDLILFATLTPDYLFPSTACLIQKALGAHKAAAMDIQAACTGYLYALSVAKAFIESGQYQNVLLVAAEKLSAITNYEDRGTCVLFGDGASAAVVSSQGAGYLVSQINLGSDGEQAHLLMMPAGGCRAPASQETVASKMHYIQMDGKEVYKHAVRRMEMAAKECLEGMHLSEEDIHYMVPHQANMRIIEGIAKRFKVPMERVYLTVQKYGNTSASSVGIALDELVKQESLLDGHRIMLVAFGAGFTWGAGILTKVEA